MNHMPPDSPASIRSKDPIATIKMESPGSESPRSIRDIHKGSGNLRGGGLQKVYVTQKPSMKRYKSKLDRRLGLCIFGCFVTIASILFIYGLMHMNVHDELTTYVNRTHQIAKELRHALDDRYPRENQTNIDKYGRQWMTVEELEYDASLIKETNSTIWNLFWWNLILALLLIPILILVHCDAVEGNLAKLVYRGILIGCLIFCIAQFLYLIHPLLWGAAKFPGMVDRLFLQAYPRDEYQINAIKERFACEFQPHDVLVQFDLQQPCIPKMKNSLFPTYTVLLLMFIDVLPFLYAIFTYAWDACIKNSKLFRNARKRVELNNSRRVPFPKQNQYEPPPKITAKGNTTTVTVNDLPGDLV
ncbi:unnamed protein product [Cylicocyclus nassatus]|uniref:Uncharacterized protein n=1 Tax=Cylicocyclus nassatus TaxID=53992 RepID=A0AA36MAU2_CYLNA|nr:unnamed protein product [Cylicocyclus nassatus]